MGKFWSEDNVQPDEVTDIFKEYAPKLKGLLLRDGCEFNLADDIIQGAFLALLEKMDGPGVRRDLLRAFLINRVRWDFRNDLTKYRREDILNEIPDFPDERTGGNEVEDKVWQIIVEAQKTPPPSSLTESHQRIMALRLAFFCSESRIAELLGLTRRKVRSEWRVVGRYLEAEFEKAGLEPEGVV